VRLQDAAPLADGSPSGACVRTSVTEGAKRIAEARSSQPLACEFEIVEAVQFVELIAEYRGSRGRARFDAASLKLSRVGG
jgi:hypothetical protein